MKIAGFSLLSLVAAVSWAGQPAGTAPAEKTSARLVQEIRATLPKFAPVDAPPAPVADAPGASEPVPADPDVLKLPKIVIKGRLIPTNDPDVWLTGRTIQQKAMAAYQDSMSPLEWALNCWYIPIFSAPPSIRARQYYEEHKLADEIDRLEHIIKTIGLTDSAEADKLHRALDSRSLPNDGRKISIGVVGP